MQTNNNSSDLVFVYRARLSMIILGFLFFGMASVGLLSMAIGNKEGLIIDHAIELSPLAATIFYWVLALASCWLLGMSVLTFVSRFSNPQQLVLTDDGLWSPRRIWSSEPDLIRYAEIRNVSRYSIKRQVFLKIVHPGGTRNITASKLPSKAAFEQFCEVFKQRLAENRQPADLGRGASRVA